MNYDLKKLFSDFNKIKVRVIGDVMLDTYWWGQVDRISPEGPVPIVSIDKKEQRIGGAGNVALNLDSLGARVTLFTVIGKDDDGQTLSKALKEKNINDGSIHVSTSRITTNKIRIIGRHQQMLRLDSELIDDLTLTDSNILLSLIEKYIIEERPAIMILQDYNKGVLTNDLIQKIVALCNLNNVYTAVDPKRKNFFSYSNVTLFKPNLKEVKESLNLLSDTISKTSLSEIHDKLKSHLNHKISLITLSEKGVFFKSENKTEMIASHIRNVADVSGAGDTVIAVAALIYATCKDEWLMAEIANIAGGLVCEEVGTAIINKQRLLEESLLLIK